MTRLFLLAALVAAPLASAQTTGQMDRGAMRPSYQMTYQADIDRLGRDLDGLDRTMRGDMRGDYTSLRQSYDELRAMTPRTDMSDPAAARQARMDYNQRYDQLAGDVYRARLTSARNRAGLLRRCQRPGSTCTTTRSTTSAPSTTPRPATPGPTMPRTSSSSGASATPTATASTRPGA